METGVDRHYIVNVYMHTVSGCHVDSTINTVLLLLLLLLLILSFLGRCAACLCAHVILTAQPSCLQPQTTVISRYSTAFIRLKQKQPVTE